MLKIIYHTKQIGILILKSKAIFYISILLTLIFLFFMQILLFTLILILLDANFI